MEEKVTFRVTNEQKNQLKRLANLNNKTLSDYAREAALSPTFDSTKIQFYQNINADLLYLKKSQLVITQLILLLGARALNSEDQIMDYYHTTLQDADNKFGGE